MTLRHSQEGKFGSPRHFFSGLGNVDSSNDKKVQLFAKLVSILFKGINWHFGETERLISQSLNLLISFAKCQFMTVFGIDDYLLAFVG